MPGTVQMLELKPRAKKKVMFFALGNSRQILINHSVNKHIVPAMTTKRRGECKRVWSRLEKAVVK